jgi:hypothetical protein
MKRILIIFLVVCTLPTLAFAGPTTAQRKLQFEKAISVVMAWATPQVSAPVRETLVRDYAEIAPNKGRAVQLVDGHYYRSGDHEDEAPIGDRTLEACQLRFEKPCALLAVNDEIVAEGELVSKDMPRLHYSGEFDLSQIPIIRLKTRNRPDVQAYFAAAGPKAIAIHPWGTLSVTTGESSSYAAQERALANCNADPRRKNKDGSCFLYAIGNVVVLAERLRSPNGAR